jgi:hypothetical protein
MPRAPLTGEGEDVVKKAVVMMLGAAALVIGGASAAKAGETVTAKVPFAFVVSGEELPAGDYVVTRDARNPELVSIATANRGRTVLVITNAMSSDMTAEPKLQFERIAGQVYLTQVTLGPGNAREIVVPAPAEDAPRR